MLVDDEIALWKAQFNLAQTYVNDGDFDQAIPLLKTALENKPDAYIIVDRLARVYEHARRFYDAELTYREAFEKLRTDDSAIGYVDYLLRRERYARALEVIDDSIRTAGEPLQLWFNILAAIVADHVGLGDVERRLEAALAISPGSGMALTMLDRLYAKRGDESRRAALRAAEFDAPLQLPPDFARRSSRYLEERRLEEAVRTAEDGLALAPKHPELLFNLALALAQLDQQPRAIMVLGLLSSGEVEVVQSGGFLRAQLLDQVGDYQNALLVLDGIFGEQPVHEDALLMRSRLLIKLDRREEAERLLHQAVRGGSGRVGVELAGLLLSSGRVAEAAAVATEALAN